MSQDFLIKKSGIAGKGVFASHDFKKGETICNFKGKRLNISEVQRLYDKGDKRVTCDSFQIFERSYIRLDDIYNSINHSCDPNAGVKKVRTLTALKNIKKGEEITFDYSATEWTPQDYTAYNPRQWPMTCACGYKFCRRKIKCFPYLPKCLRDKYIKSGIIQNFILRKIAQPWEKTRCFVCEQN
jgi:SET domain-containing protein